MSHVLGEFHEDYFRRSELLRHQLFKDDAPDICRVLFVIFDVIVVFNSRFSFFNFCSGYHIGYLHGGFYKTCVFLLLEFYWYVYNK